jgi:dTDP-4-amino-4,6-dideoxygalactose transaminase
MLARREALAAGYDAIVDGWDGVSRQPRPATRSDGRHALHLYAVVVDPQSVTVSRDHLVAAMRAENIGVAVHYEAVHRQPYYAGSLGARDEDLPGASHIGSWTISLPLSPDMTDGHVSDVLAATEKILGHYRR